MMLQRRLIQQHVLVAAHVSRLAPNGSAMLFTSAKINHLEKLPQGKIEHTRRVRNMVNQMDKEGFGKCSNVGACHVECPKEIRWKIYQR